MCQTFPALDPIKVRETKAREVFLLFRRTEKLNKKIKEQEKKYELKNSSKSNKEQIQNIDVTGVDNGWY